MTDHLWTYRARPDPNSDYELGVVDGDTYDIVVDLGFKHYYRARLRSSAVNTAEIFGVSDDSEEYERGVQHKLAARQWLHDVAEKVDAEWPLIVKTYPDTGKYGRWIGELYRPDVDDPDEIQQASTIGTGESLGEHLLEQFDDVTEV